MPSVIGIQSDIRLDYFWYEPIGTERDVRLRFALEELEGSWRVNPFPDPSRLSFSG
jgi:hypothetical protein